MRVGFLEMALQGKKIGFEKVIMSIDALGAKVQGVSPHSDGFAGGAIRRVRLRGESLPTDCVGSFMCNYGCGMRGTMSAASCTDAAAACA